MPIAPAHRYRRPLARPPMGLMRIPYTDPLPAPRIFPATAATFGGAVAALADFLCARRADGYIDGQRRETDARTLVLTGAGVSVASGLADYRGASGTYTLNKAYRPIYYHEFTSRHDARQRYWARSFLGWPTLDAARPNSAHLAIGKLGQLGIVPSVITQNVDGFHTLAHPHLPTIELHGHLRALVCLTCRREYPRSAFQTQLARLNPAWRHFLAKLLASGALATEDPAERRAKGLRTNPDGDVEVHGVDYSTFRYPACPRCLSDLRTGKLKPLANGDKPCIELDDDGAWMPTSNAGILKPAVVMFGETVADATKQAVERALDAVDRILVVGSSLATYSAWRIVKRASDTAMRIGMLNVGGVRGEEGFFRGTRMGNTGSFAVRVNQKADLILPEVVKVLEESGRFKR